ncbi:hypothetical protein BT69DRAFT_315803 [Atractiella rhizophila]|nr:hypothetical protein BT69DRAFT_315803 [Atractiella rhizophila]
MFTDESSIQVQSPIQSPNAEVASLASDPDRQTTSGSEMMDELEGMIADAIDAQGNVVETPPSGKTKGRPSSFHEATPTRPKILTEIKNDLPAIPGMIRTTTSPSMASTPSPTKMEPREGRRHSMMAFSTPTGKENFSARTRKTTLLLGLNRPYPAAMDYSDIKAMRTPNERAIAYAKKINELAKEDSGLHIWLSCIKEQQYGSGFRSPSNSTHGVTNAKLHTRDFSGASEFPTRPDAYKAKELTRSPPTSIPYPGAVPKRHGGTGSISTPNTLSRASGPKSSTSGFFSTLGRKTSRSVRSPTAALASRSAAPIGTVSAPTLNLGTIKGGPRMPYNGSTTLSSFSEAEDRISSPISETPHATIRQSMLTARPTISSTKSSFVYGSGKTEDGLSDKLDKLADILPQANRDVLKDYLIRANGDDLLVVGQYLDDERSGRV